MPVLDISCHYQMHLPWKELDNMFSPPKFVIFNSPVSLNDVPILLVPKVGFPRQLAQRWKLACWKFLWVSS